MLLLIKSTILVSKSIDQTTALANIAGLSGDRTVTRSSTSLN